MVTYDPSGDYVALGYLPCDSNQDLLSEALDVTALITCLNLPGTCHVCQTDINRDTAPEALDVTRLITLLNTGWNNKELPAVP